MVDNAVLDRKQLERLARKIAENEKKITEGSVEKTTIEKSPGIKDDSP